MEYHFDQAAGTLTGFTGLIMVIIFVVYIGVVIYAAKKKPYGETERKKEPLWKCILMIVVGLALVIAGGQAVVYGAKEIARTAGMTETLIGLTIVAIGTSLPELVTSVVAAKKGETGLAIGNVVGSNIFNLLFILGTSSMICPLEVNAASIYDMIILIAVCLLTFFFSFSSRRIARKEGIIMVVIYAADMAFAIMR